jgi:hypothetical protein
VWIDGDDGHPPSITIASAALRGHANWTLAGNRALVLPPFFVARADIESMVESIIGHSIHANKLYWGERHGRWVESKRQTSDPRRQTSHFDLDLAYVQDNWFNPEVDVDFDLRVTCANNRLKMEATNVKVDVDGNDLVDVLTFGIQPLVIERVEAGVNASLSRMGLFSTSSDTPVCPTIRFDDDGNLRLGWLSR